ncbi:MAG: DUF2345 domain-containing protein, partial [Enterobacteriaceae bacterium]|nr:DUF2345 domain-containing protein [Enterobacteriaceae bacterium]
QSKGVGEALDRQTVLNEIEITKNKIQALNECARQSQALEADIRAQIAMFEERLKPIKRTILAHAPQGVALTSGEHLQLAAKQNVIANAGGDGSVGVVNNLTVQTGEQFGVFAHKGGISLKASEGKVDVQAQNNMMSLTAKGKISLTAIDGDLLFSAKKRIVLVGGGSYLILQQGGIEYGTQHDYLRYTGHTVLTVPETMPLNMPVMGTAYIYSAIYQLVDKSGNVLVNTPYRLTTPSGQVKAGYSDNEGRTVPVYTNKEEELELHVVLQKPQPKETLYYIGQTDPLEMETEYREEK